MLKKLLHIILLLNFCAMQSQQLVNNISVSKVTTDDGLSQGSNYFRFEDSLGFMWITGNDAVNRYDGSRVKVYNLNKYFSNCPNLQQGYGFAEDDKTNVYVGSINGLYIYNRNQDKFTLQKIYGGYDETVMAIAYKDDKVWCYNKQFEIVSFDVKTKKITNFGKLPLPAMKSIHIYDIGANIFYCRFPFLVDDAIWIVDANQVLTFNIKTKAIEFHLKALTDKKVLKFYASCYDAKSKSIFIGGDNKILKYSIETKVVLIKNLEPNKNKEIVSGTGLASNGNLLAFVQSGKLYVCDLYFKNIQKLNGNFTYSNYPFNLNFDKNNRLWICKDGLGAYILDFKQPLINKENAENQLLKKYIEYSVISFAEFPNKDILINECVVKSFKNNNYEIIPNPQTYNSFRATTDFYRGGIWQFYTSVDKSTKIFFTGADKNKKLVASLDAKLNLGQIQDMAALDNHAVLLSFQKGLYWFDPLTKNITKIPNQPQNNCFKINKLSNNRLAISYLNNDMWLAQIDEKNNVTFLRPILPKHQSFYMQEDTIKKQFWVGTNNGVYLLDKNFTTISKFDANNGMAGTYIYGILQDNDGNIWCSHQRGLSSIEANSYKIINYTPSDGIQDWDFNNRAFYKATDGTLYFGGVKGFNYFKPPLNRQKKYKTSVYIDEILVNSIPLKSENCVNSIAKLDLKSNENNLSFYAVINDLENGASQNILYRLNKSKWNTIKNPNYINFSSLSPDKYILELATFDKFLNRTTIQKTIAINIENPFYRTIWFWSLISFVISTILYVYFAQRKLNRQNTAFKQQLELEKQRNKMTADLHDDIGATLSSLQLNSAIANQLYQKNASQAQKLLTKIEQQAEDLADKIGDIIWSMKPGKDEFLTMSSRIKNFANDILGSTNIDYKIEIDQNADTTILDIPSRKNIVLFVKEATNNAAKYSQATTFEIILKIIDNQVNIEINDNGIGFNVDEAHGNGIGNMKRRIDELNGQFFIVSEPKKGTHIKARIPFVP